jgi:Catalase
MQTPIATRFSLVTHPKGSPESLRDTRGMAVGSHLALHAESGGKRGCRQPNLPYSGHLNSKLWTSSNDEDE